MSVLLQMVESIRPFVREKAKEKLDYFVTHIAQASNIEQKINAYNKWLHLRDIVKQKSTRLDPVDTDFEIVFFPHENHFLGIAYTNNTLWFEKWMSLDLVEDYSYWNNTDKPKELTDEQWNQRAENWDKVLGYNIPAMVGFSICVADPNGPSIID